MSTIQVEQGVGAWLEFMVVDKDDELPIVLVEASEIRVWYKKFGQLEFTELTPLVTVADKADPQPGENFVEVGFGVYAIHFSGSELDTLETFYWAVTPKDPGALDFKQWTQQVDVIEDTNWIQKISDIDTTVATIDTNVTDGFDTNEIDHDETHTKQDTAQNSLDVIQGIVEDIEDALPSGINTSFVE